MQPPTVRTIDQLKALTNPLYDPARQSANEQINLENNNAVEGQRGIIAARDKGFGDIAQMASNRNMLFSGFTPDAQAKYLGEKFLPAMANLQSTTARNLATLREKLLGYDAEQNKTALNLQEQDKSALSAWQAEQDRRAWQQKQDELAYQREMQKMQADHAFTASENAKQRALQYGPGGADAKPSNAENFASALAAAAGKDGKVSPGDYNALKKQWVSSGYGDYKSFHDKFWNFANNSHWWDYYYN